MLRVFIEFRPSLNSNMWAGSDFAELNAKFWFKIGVPAFKTIQKIAQCEIRILLCIVCSVRISLRNSAPVYRSILLYRSRQVCEIFTQHSISSVSIYPMHHGTKISTIIKENWEQGAGVRSTFVCSGTPSVL